MTLGSHALTLDDATLRADRVTPVACVQRRARDTQRFAALRRACATVLIALQMLTPLAAWPQTPRSTAPASPAGSPAAPPAPSKGPVSERRLALIIGNNNYKTAPLINPINDARLVTETLRALGFEVILRENVSLRDFKAVMRQFVTRMENEDGTALFYYAGHGVQIEGRNYLLPVDVGIGDEYEVRDESLDLEETLMSRLSKARKRERIIVLDACRDNPFRQAKAVNRAVTPRGFAQMGSDEKGMLIVYSTSPGHTAEDGTGKNSVFTQYFAQEIQKEGVEIGQALRSVFNQVNSQTKGRQTPWINSSLMSDFYFRPPNLRAEEERRKKEIQEKVDAALAQQKRDEAARIAAVVGEREKERERERVERERMYNAQIAEMKAMLERRDRDLQQAKLQMASAAKTRDEQLAILAQVEAERQRVERERASLATAAPPAPPPPTREQEEARRKAEVDVAMKRAQEQTIRAERDRFLRLESERRNADEREQKEAAEREAKAAAEAARREAAAKNRAEKERLAQEQMRRKAADEVRRAEQARQAKATNEMIRQLEEKTQTAQKARQAAEAVPVLAQAATAGKPAADDSLARASERVKKAREDAERAAREAETQARLAQIEESVSRRAQLEYEMLGKRANTPPEIASLMIVEPQKVIVTGSNGDFFVRGVRLPPDVSIRPAASNVPGQCAAFVGAWGGGRWNGERTAEIWIESVDADCRAKAIYARGGQGLSGELATYIRGEGRVRGDTVTLDFGSARIELSKDGDGMNGRWSSGTGSATARFVKIPAQPDRGVSLFANEMQDFGAAPSRVISTSQISDRAMLPLPMVVPSVDTLTTVQLDAFLKSHPDAVLVDAVVSGAHNTLPGAYWMPELGQVTVGALELDQIANTLRGATGGDRSRPIIVFERSSTYGWFGYHGVLRLLGMGYSNIYWYRGGVDAWHDAAFPTAQAKAWSKAG